MALHSSGRVSDDALVTSRLKDMIMDCVHDKLVLLDGVEGMGKTRLMRFQRDALREKEGHNVVWLSSTRLAYEGISIGEGIVQVLRKGGLPGRKDTRAYGREAIDILEKSRDTWHIYIANVDELCDEEMSYIETLVNLTSDNVHVVVSIASGAAAHFRRLKADLQMTEIGRTDLMFTAEETRAIAQRCMHTVGESYAARLFEITLGWPVLVEFALSNATTERELERLCDEPGFTLERFTEGIMGRLTADEIEFLMHVCWLDSFSVSLVKRATRRLFPEAIIRRLLSQSIIVESAAGAGVRRGVPGLEYQCHPFLRASICAYAHANISSVAIEETMGRILDCYEADEEYLSAFAIAMANSMYDRAFCLLAQNLFAILPHVKVSTLTKLLGSCSPQDGPDEYLYLLIYSWTMFLSGKYRRAQYLLGKVERYKGNALRLSRIKGVRVLDQTIRVGCTVFRGEYEKAIELGKQLSERMGGPQLFMRCTVMHNMGEAYLRLGRYREAKDAMLRASADAFVSGRYVVWLLCESDIAWLKFTKGNLDASSNVALRALARAEEEGMRQGWAVGVLFVSLARVYLQWGEVGRAHAYLERAATLLSPNTNRDAFLESKVTLVRLLELEGRHEEGYEQIVMAHEMTLWDSVPRGVDLLVIVTFAELLLSRGRYEEALGLIDELESKAAPADDFYRIHASLVRARALILGYADVARAMSVLEAALKRANEAGQMLLATDCKIRLACAYRMDGRVEDGINLMAQALDECAKEGRVYPFREPLPFQNTLVYEIAFPTSNNLVIDTSRKAARDHARVIVERLKERGAFEYEDKPLEGEDERYVSLTERERDVCELLKRGMTRQQIANELGLKLNTVRTHIRSVYKKLDIHERSML